MIRSCLKVTLLMVLLVSTSFATWQEPDKLIYEGKEYSLYHEFLSGYFKKYPDRHPKKDDKHRWSANWRGYVAFYEISNGELILKDIFQDSDHSRKNSELLTVVPDGKPLKIDWYSGVLVSMDGDNDGDSYSSEFLIGFAEYSFFEFDKGRFSTAKHFDNKGFHAFKKEQFEKYKKTEEFKHEVKEITDRESSSAEEAEKSVEFWHVFSLKKFL